MDIKSKIIAAVLLILSLTSCTSTVKLYTGLTKRKGTLKYIYDSKQETVKDNKYLVVTKPVITDKYFNRPGSIHKVKSFVLPLIVFNMWSSEHKFQIGRDMIMEDIPTFVQTSFLGEVNRSTQLTADSIVTALNDSTVSNNPYTLEVEIDSLGATGPYYEQGYVAYAFYFLRWGHSQKAGPGLAYSKFYFRLREGDKVLLEDFVSYQVRTEPVVRHQASSEALQINYTTSLVEALSLTFKSNIEKIIKNVELYIN